MRMLLSANTQGQSFAPVIWLTRHILKGIHVQYQLSIKMS